MIPPVYYNEIDPFAATWLRSLIAAGHLPAGEVDERSIWDVCPDDLHPFRQCHFFAGIGGWAHAARLARWPTDWPLWTGSCPCQPFSAAGQGRGFADERHLWPAWFHLIDECRPPIIAGEQVAKALGWLDLVYADLEGADYAVWAGDLCAPSVGAFHIRQRLWFVADTLGERRDEQHTLLRSDAGRRLTRAFPEAHRGGEAHLMADAQRHPRGPRRLAGESREGVGAAGARASVESGRCGDAGELGDAAIHRVGAQHWQPSPSDGWTESAGGPNLPDQLEHTQINGRQSRGSSTGKWRIGSGCREDELGDPDPTRSQGRRLLRAVGDGISADQQSVGPSGPDGPTFWSDADWLPCIDGKSRPVEPGTFPLAHGVPARVGRLRGYGNAIVPQVAAEVLRAYLNTYR